MKLSWQWLQEFVDLPKGISAETVGDKLTLHTAELEEIIERKEFFGDVFFGKLLSVDPHPEADKLSVAQFDLERHGQKQIVFGQVHEVRVGEILPVALSGARLASGLEIKNSEIRGQKSEGMIADNSELGLKQPGLLRLADEKFIGKSLPEVIRSLGDTLFDIDNKSLTHRPDLVGHRGFARELSAIFGTKLVLPEPVVAVPDLHNGLDAKIDTKGCRRFCGLRMDQITVEPSPLEHQMRLENLGVRAISNLVDITNLIMLEYGQPMHVFDADKVQGDIIVRMAQAGESLVALDGETYELSPEDIVIADEAGILSIAGIMGGEASSVTESTTRVIFESANFDPVTVRKTSQRLGLRSESSMRFEKSLDPEQCRKALMAAAEMTQTLCSQATITSQIVDRYPSRAKPLNLTLDPAKIQALAGIDIAWKDMEKILTLLGFQTQKQKDKVTVFIPSWRSTKDVAITEDIVEEIVRIHGLDKVPTVLPSFSVNPPTPNHLRRLQWAARQQLASLGYFETYLHSFLDMEHLKQIDPSDYVEVANPLSEAYRYLRRELWPQLVYKLESGLRRHRQVAFFELGKVYHVVKGEVLPTETERLLLVRAALNLPENDTFFALKADLETLMQQVKVKNYTLQPARNPAEHWHPAKTLDLILNNQVVGQVGVLHPRFAPTKGAVVALAELDLPPLLESQQATDTKYQAASSFPEVYRDISLIVDGQTYAADLMRTAKAAAPLLTKIQLFDEYQDAAKIGPGLKNLAFHLTFQSPDQTLTETQIELEFDRLVKAFEQDHHAKIRLQFDNA